MVGPAGYDKKQIGHIMEAHAKSLAFIGNEGKIRIPFFQRGYVWDERNWEDLISELLNFKRNHFLGSLILKQQKPVSGEPKEVVVIDGQQRLTTLSVLLKSIYDLFSDELKEVTRPAILTYLFFKKKQTDKNHILKLQHSHIDTVAYKRVVESESIIGELDSITTSSSTILRCYKFFIKHLQTVEEDARKQLFNDLLDENNKILVVIDLSENDNEQAIFDTINSAGVRLSSADIIKNSIFQKTLLLTENQDEVVELYESSWKKTFMHDESTVQFWDSERTTGRLMRDNIEILLHSISVINGFYDPDKHTLSDLGDVYKDNIESIPDSKSAERMIIEICDYALIYREHIATFNSSSLLGFDDDLRRLLQILDSLQITTFHPFILYVLKNRKDEDVRGEIFRKLEKFIIRRLITNGDTKGYNKICKEFIDNLDSLTEKSCENSDEDVSIGLKKIENRPAALLLFWIELRRRSLDQGFDIKELKYSYSLEHLMPQKWEEHWPLPPNKVRADGTAMSTEESIKDRYAKIYEIGNMTLLTTSLNSSLRNFEFKRKVEGEGKKKGIKHYSSLTVTSEDIVRPFDNGDTNWDEEKITTRTNKLTQEVLSIW